MTYYDDPKNVESYIQMAEGYDGRELIDLLQQHLRDGATVLELGMGPGIDLDMLAEHYQVTGSDRSVVFLERYQAARPDVDLMQLDALRLETERRFDCIYSNKVLHHLSRDELAESFRRQADLLNNDGLLCHSFWFGDHEEEMHGLTFVYYTEESLARQLGDAYEVLDLVRTAEMEEGDTLFVVAQKRSA